MTIAMVDMDKPFRTARSKAWVAALLDLLRGESSDMLAFADVQASLYIRGERARGRQLVPVDQIIGSEGRYLDFDRRFLPRAQYSEDRWLNIKHAMARRIALPPVELYKISDVYFVRDGNHRVSVARYLERADIEADVTELLVDVVLTPALSIRTLLLAQENSDFLEWTNLHTLRPTEKITFSELGGYLDLVRDINIHRSALVQEQHRPISRDEVVTSWYDTVYLPRMQAIRAQQLVRYCAGRTEADLYRWILSHGEQRVHCGICPPQTLHNRPAWERWQAQVATIVTRMRAMWKLCNH